METSRNKRGYEEGVGDAAYITEPKKPKLPALASSVSNFLQVHYCDIKIGLYGSFEGGQYAKTLLIFGANVYKNHYPPALHDEVRRLDKIAKDAA